MKEEDLHTAQKTPHRREDRDWLKESTEGMRWMCEKTGCYLFEGVDRRHALNVRVDRGCYLVGINRRRALDV